jgi:hypothetical protein
MQETKRENEMTTHKPPRRLRTRPRDSYLVRLEADIREWAKPLQSLEERLALVSDEVREGLAVELRTMRVVYLSIRSSVRSLHGTGEEVGETLRPKVEQAWDACKADLQALDAAVQRAARSTPRRES